MVTIQGYKKRGKNAYEIRTIKTPNFIGRHIKRRLERSGANHKDLTIRNKEAHLFESPEQDVLICVE